MMRDRVCGDLVPDLPLPSLARLTRGSEVLSRSLSLGYRAKGAVSGAQAVKVDCSGMPLQSTCRPPSRLGLASQPAFRTPPGRNAPASHLLGSRGPAR